jgi:uncharacterized membrane protein YcgQ (UPF0703/DUF1980 family)
MAHDHSHDDRNAYYLNQLFTIAVCGALGGVAVMLYVSGKLQLMLHPKFFIWVLLGGVALLALVVIRAVAVWRSVDEPAHDHDDCGHEHDHCHHDHEHDMHAVTHAHDHDHGHDHSHDHDHNHEHGWAPWRYVVLLLPVVLYFLNLPNKGFSADDALNDVQLKAPTSVRAKGSGTIDVGFLELQNAALDPGLREFFEGRTVALTGQYIGNNPKQFGLQRKKIACCGADAVSLNAIIAVDDQSSESVDPDRYRNKWIEVKGRIQFVQKSGSNEFITRLILYPTKEEPIDRLVKIIPPPPTPYVF